MWWRGKLLACGVQHGRCIKPCLMQDLQGINRSFRCVSYKDRVLAGLVRQPAICQKCEQARVGLTYQEKK